jgi:hypothetical protein
MVVVRAQGAGKNKAPPYYCIEEAHAQKEGPSQEKPKGSKSTKQLLSVLN